MFNIFCDLLNIALLSLKYSQLGQSNNYDTKLVLKRAIQGSNGFKAIFHKLCHTPNTITLYYCEVSSKPFQLII